MGLDLTTITSYAPPVYDHGQVFLSWTSTAPAGSWYQLYLAADGAWGLAWWGQKLSATVAAPPAVESFIVGTVPAGEEQTSFASSLPPVPLRQVTLTWLGGTFEAVDLAGFNVYGETVAGAGINFGSPLATITAYAAGIVTDGFGLGGFGLGGWGESAGQYTWTSNTLTSGTWHYAVLPFDTAGNLGAAATTSQTIAVPPSAPPIDAFGRRLEYTYNPSTFEATLTWLASTA